MRLTNAIRESFVDSVIRAVPVTASYDGFDAAVKLCKLVESRYAPALVLEFSSKHGELLKRNKVIYCEELNEVSVTGIRTRCFSFYVVDALPFDIEQLLAEDVEYQALVKSLASDKVNQVAEKEKLSDMRARLRAVTMSCTTTEKLALALPELTHFIPKEVTPTAQLPVSTDGIAGDLFKAGLTIPKE